jgi:hypothetical protein
MPAADKQLANEIQEPLCMHTMNTHNEVQRDGPWIGAAYTASVQRSLKFDTAMIAVEEVGHLALPHLQSSPGHSKVLVL